MPDKIVPLWKVVGEVSETTFLDHPNTQYEYRAQEDHGAQRRPRLRRDRPLPPRPRGLQRRHVAAHRRRGRGPARRALAAPCLLFSMHEGYASRQTAPFVGCALQMPNGSPDHTASSLWLRPRSVSPAIPFASKAASHSSVGLERAPALLQGRGRERAPLLSALPMERQLCAGNRDDLGNLQGAGMWQPRDSRGAPAGASPPRHSQHCCRYGPRQHCSFHRGPAKMLTHDRGSQLCGPTAPTRLQRSRRTAPARTWPPRLARPS